MPLDAQSVFLVVDDARTMRAFLTKALHELGYKHVLSAEDGHEALLLLKQQDVDCVICDWNMPKMSGLELLQEVRDDPATARVPFIMVTTAADKDHVVAAIQAGVSSYIVKPLTVETLAAKLTQAANWRG